MQPDIKVQLLGLPGSRELPCISGHTVVPSSCDATLVVGHPNHLGVFDGARATRTIVLTGRWSALRPVPTGATVIPLEDSIPEHVAAIALAHVRQLAKRLRQLKGLQVAIRPRSPVLIVLLPFSSGVDGFTFPGVTTLESHFPEYPGGVRIEPPFDEAGFDVSRYAAGLEQVIMEET